MITSSIIQRTFSIKAGDSSATGFTVDIDNLQYLVTAKHVIENLNKEDGLDVYHDGQWKELPIKKLWMSDSGADLALISFHQQISPSHKVNLEPHSGYFLSQTAYFLGFPFGLKLEAGQTNNGYPVPFVKSAIISSFTLSKTGSETIFLDGLNNPGFSGGPIVTTNPDHSTNIIGVVSGYRYSNDPIHINGKDSGLTYKSNTGLVIGYTIKEILDEARSSQSGAPLTS
ncbi:serine protease [Pseudomonas canadensis]|uniref:S1 family peptidase n=1 Tax=Pseudomonas canadensis TaxID=915099 RepID=UPI00336A9CF9